MMKNVLKMAGALCYAIIFIVSAFAFYGPKSHPNFKPEFIYPKKIKIYHLSVPIIPELLITTKQEKIKESPKKIYLGKWRISEYCSRCNSGGSHQTASGRKADEWWTCAVSRSNYKKLKGKTLYISGWGEFEVQDWGSVHGCNPNEWVDLFLPSSYHNDVWEKANVYILEN